VKIIFFWRKTNGNEDEENCGNIFFCRFSVLFERKSRNDFQRLFVQGARRRKSALKKEILGILSKCQIIKEK